MALIYQLFALSLADVNMRGKKKTLMTLSMEGRVRLLAVTLMDLFIKTNELGEI